MDIDPSLLQSNFPSHANSTLSLNLNSNNSLQSNFYLPPLSILMMVRDNKRKDDDASKEALSFARIVSEYLYAKPGFYNPSRQEIVRKRDELTEYFKNSNNNMVKLIKTHSIQCPSFQRSKITGEEIISLLPKLKNYIRELDVSQNGIKDSESEVFCELMRHGIITSLKIHSNPMTDQTARKISETIKYSSLTSLDFHNNKMGLLGLKNLLGGITNSHIIKSQIHQSTSKYTSDSMSDEYIKTIKQINEAVEQNRERAKILSIAFHKLGLTSTTPRTLKFLDLNLVSMKGKLEAYDIIQKSGGVSAFATHLTELLFNKLNKCRTNNAEVAENLNAILRDVLIKMVSEKFYSEMRKEYSLR